MKKIIFITMFFVGTLCTNALELTYSEWSEKYPSGVDEILIESEDRYLWYKETIYDIEYLRIEDINDKLYDVNDYEYYESEEMFEKPEEYSERNIIEYNKQVIYTSNDSHGLILQSNDDVLISEVVIYDENHNLINFNSSIQNLNDGIKDIYYPINNEIVVSFDNNYDMRNIYIYIYYNYYENNEAHLKANIVSKNNDVIYYVDYYFNYCNSFGCSFDVNSNVLLSNFYHTKKVYIYIDKLYKTYRINRDYVSEYYKELDGYEKDIESKKTFYRYITNNYLIFDTNNNIVTDESLCEKEFCMIAFYDTVVDDEEPVVPEPEPSEPPAIDEPLPSEPPEEEPPVIDEPLPSEPPEEEPIVVDEPIVDTPIENDEQIVIPQPNVEEEPQAELPHEDPIIIIPEEKNIDIVPLVSETNNDIDDLIVNPKTYDPLYDFIVLFIISLIAVTYFIVEKGRTNKKSNNVETI